MAQAQQRYEGKVALITGAGVRLGRAIAVELAAHGCHILLHANRSAKEAEALARGFVAAGREAAVLRADLSKTAQVEKLAREAWARFGRVDFLINNAANFHASALKGLDASALDEAYAVNLRAPFILASELGRLMKAGEGAGRVKGGSIVNMACLSAARPWKDYIPYSISKAGVVAMTAGLAKILAPEVRVNAVAPGTVLPPEGMDTKRREELRARIPLQRLGRPDDVVRAVRYLLDAPFVTGQVMSVDGGRSLV
ncbi:MAG: SDR family oxidoreductase [Planctomycetota bacterium]|nr:SDR family oxidoreductase [Planctomycetota bacterium]